MNAYTFEEISVGDQEIFNVKITNEMMQLFRTMSGDNNPLHNDEEYARKLGYRGRVVYGMLVSSFYSTLAGEYLPGKYSLIHSIEIGMIKPTYIGDELIVSGKVVGKVDAYKIIELKIQIVNQNGEKISKGKMNIKVGK